MGFYTEMFSRPGLRAQQCRRTRIALLPVFSGAERDVVWTRRPADFPRLGREAAAR